MPWRTLAFAITGQVFARFGIIEVVLALLTAILAVFARPAWLIWIALIMIWATVAVQTFWLQPVLAARAEQLLAGQTPLPGPWHTLFIGALAIRLLALIAAAWTGLLRETRQSG